MAVLDISIVNVALSDIRASFGTPLDQIAWVSTGYMMANMVVIPMTGWLQRRFGFRQLLHRLDARCSPWPACCAAWRGTCRRWWCSASSRAWAAAPSSPPRRPSSSPATRARSTAWRARSSAWAPSPGRCWGPPSAATSSTSASWHWIFLINVPVGLFAAYMAWRFIEQPGFEPATETVDTTASRCSPSGMASLQYVLEEGNREGWFDSRLITLLAVVAAIALITFIVHELETPSPGGGPARVQQPQLRGGHGRELPRRARRCSPARSCSRSSAAR